jgi:rod shape-determining protein MreC
MQQIIYFIKKFRYFLLFVFLELIAFNFILQHHSFHRSKFVSSANSLSGNLYEKVNNISEFFLLKEENKRLNEENTRLLNLLEKSIDSSYVSVLVDDTQFGQKYKYRSAKVINNNFTKRNNYLTIDKGLKDSVFQDMGVINNKGIIGVIKNTSNRFATVLSILNGYSKINIRLKNSAHFGTLVWDGKDYNTMQITDIPRQAILSKGDTIITGGKSAIFPEGIPVGVIKDFRFSNNKYEQIHVQLFNDMSAIGHVQVIQNLLKKEQVELELNNANE